MLAVLVGVLVAATAVFVILFLLEKSAVGDTNGQVTSTEKQISDEKGKLDDVKGEVDTLEQEGKDLQSTKDELQACVDAAKAALQAGQTGTDEELSAAVDKMQLDCAEGTGT